MPYVLIIHEVENYAAWKDIFDQATDIRKNAGEVHYQLLHEDGNPEQIVHFSQWHSLEEAREFFESPALRALRIQAGVKTHEFIYLNQIEHGIL